MVEGLARLANQARSPGTVRSQRVDEAIGGYSPSCRRLSPERVPRANRPARQSHRTLARAIGPGEGLPESCVITYDSIVTVPLDAFDRSPVGQLDEIKRSELDRALRYALDILIDGDDIRQ